MTATSSSAAFEAIRQGKSSLALGLDIVINLEDIGIKLDIESIDLEKNENNKLYYFERRGVFSTFIGGGWINKASPDLSTRIGFAFHVKLNGKEQNRIIFFKLSELFSNEGDLKSATIDDIINAVGEKTAIGFPPLVLPHRPPHSDSKGSTRQRRFVRGVINYSLKYCFL